MRGRTAVAVLAVVLTVATGGVWVSTVILSSTEAPEASFEIGGDPGAGELIVEHAGGESFESGTLRILVYEDRPIVPDRTVHGTVWEVESGVVGPGDWIELSDPRFEPSQRVVVRWFGPDGQTNVYETIV